nr:sorbitol dehydrogenase family protein [Devosia faecipullorum]
MISNWYTGVAETKGGDEVVTYTEALMWEALDFTKPMGWCGGETGYWTDAPEGEA